MRVSRRHLQLLGVLALVATLTSCLDLGFLMGPEPEIDLSPPSWIQGTWTDPDTGEEITFTSTDVLFDGSSLRSWAERNELSVEDFRSSDPSDSRFSHAYWINAGAPGSDLSLAQRQFDAFRWVDPSDWIRVVVRPTFSGLNSIDFQQDASDTGAGTGGSGTGWSGTVTTGISVWTSNSGQGFIDVSINGNLEGTLTSYLSSGTPDYGQTGTITVELSAGTHSIYAVAQSGATWGPTNFTLDEGDRLVYELR